MLFTKESKIKIDGVDYSWTGEPTEREIGHIGSLSWTGDVETTVTEDPKLRHYEFVCVTDGVIHLTWVDFFKAKLTNGVATHEFSVVAKDISEAKKMVRKFVELNPGFTKLISIAPSRGIFDPCITTKSLLQTRLKSNLDFINK